MFLLPATKEFFRPCKQGFRETAESFQGQESFRGSSVRGLLQNRFPKRFRREDVGAVSAEQFPQREGVQPVEGITPEKGISSLLVNVQPTAASHKQFQVSAVDVKQPLEKPFPSGVLVDFIQCYTDPTGGPLATPCRHPEGFGVLEDRSSVRVIIPVEVVRRSPYFFKQTLRQRGLPHLPRTGNEGHTLFLSKEAFNGRSHVAHTRILHIALKKSRPF